jgi:hypothetical protein
LFAANGLEPLRVGMLALPVLPFSAGSRGKAERARELIIEALAAVPQRLKRPSAGEHRLSNGCRRRVAGVRGFLHVERGSYFRSPRTRRSLDSRDEAVDRLWRCGGATGV